MNEMVLNRLLFNFIDNSFLMMNKLTKLYIPEEIAIKQVVFSKLAFFLYYQVTR